MFEAVFFCVLKFVIFLALGWVLSRTHTLSEQTPEVLSKLLVNLLLPAMIIQSFVQNFTPQKLAQNIQMFLIAVISTAMTVGLSALFSKILTKDPFRRNVCIVALTVPNVSYLGSPLVLELFGSEALMHLLVYILPMSVFANTIGFALLTGTSEKLGFRLNPPLAASVLGMLLGLLGIKLPAFVDSILIGCSSCVGVLSMLLVGCVLSKYSLKLLVQDKTQYPVIIMRMLGIPAVCLLAGHTMQLQPQQLLTLVAANCMPTNLSTVIFPASVGKESQFGAGMALISMILALVTVPLILSFVC